MMSTLVMQRFIDSHPPEDKRQPISYERIAAWCGYVPASLIELWSCCGFGFYGKSQLCLLNPDEWLPILNRWITPTESIAERVPVLLSPFGDLFYYRRLPGEEDISVIYIDTFEVAVINFSLEEFFNGTLCNSNQLRNLMPAQLDRIQKRYGLLAHNQIYRKVPPAKGQPVSVEKVSAHLAHAQLLDEIHVRSLS